MLRPIALAMTLALGPAAGQAQTVTVAPSVEASLKYTDNSKASSNKDGAFVAEVSPGLSVVRESGRFRGHLNSRLRNVAHLNDSDRNSTFLSLQGFGELEAVERRLFIDADASINRNNRSLLEGRSGDDSLNTESSNETRSFGIHPRWVFFLGPETRGTVVYSSRWMSGGGGLRTRREEKWNANVENPDQFGMIGWGLNYSKSETEGGRAGQGKAPRESARATLFAKVTPQFRLRGIGGVEKSEFEPGKEENNSIVGAGFDWHPTERTTISATTEKRFFGRGYDVSISHRRPLSVWNLSYVRDVSSSMETQGASVFADPDFRALYDALETSFPDPVLREALVRLLLGYPPIGPRDFFVTDVHFLTRRLAATASFIGVRNILTVSMSQNERSRLEPAAGLDSSDEFSQFGTLKSRVASVSLSHKLSRESALNTSLSHTRSEGQGATVREVKRSQFNIGVTRQLSPETSAGLSYRFQRASGTTEFTENVIMATLSMRF